MFRSTCGGRCLVRPHCTPRAWWPFAGTLWGTRGRSRRSRRRLYQAATLIFGGGARRTASSPRAPGGTRAWQWRRRGWHWRRSSQDTGAARHEVLRASGRCPRTRRRWSAAWRGDLAHEGPVRDGGEAAVCERVRDAQMRSRLCSSPRRSRGKRKRASPWCRGWFPSRRR